jgi:hypothetical protein
MIAIKELTIKKLHEELILLFVRNEMTISIDQEIEEYVLPWYY